MDRDAKTDLTGLLRDKGYSLTRQRQLVFESLVGQEPMTMRELLVRTKGQLDPASLYRNVALFEKLGIIQRLNMGWKYKLELSDMFAEHHHHLTCLNCGRIIPINEDELEAFVRRAAESQGFKATAHQIEIQGYCANCRKA